MRTSRISGSRRCTGSVIGVLTLAACLTASPGAAQTKPLNTIRELFDAFGACWRPPPLDQSKPGTEITIRFSLNAAGEIMGEPRFTYSSPALSSDVKSASAVSTSAPSGSEAAISPL